MDLGDQVEEDFDFAKGQRRDRLWWAVLGGCSLLGVAYIVHPFWLFAIILQGYFLTTMSYGDTFYVQRNHRLRGALLWKVVLLTLPVHLLFICGIIMMDRLVPSIATKVLVGLPVIFLCFGIECVFFDRAIARFT